MATFTSTTNVINYIISVTGDTTSSGIGAIKISNNSVSGNQETYLFDWVEPNLNYDYNVSSSTRTNLVAGSYLVKVSNNAVPENDVQYITIPVTSSVTCNILNIKDTTCGIDNGSVTGQTSSIFGNDIFNLYDTNNSLIATFKTPFFQNLSAGTYYMTTEDFGGCTGTSKTFVIQDSKPLDFGFFVVPNSVCGGNAYGKLMVTGETGTPPYTYVWNNGETGTTITGLTTGPYSVVVTDSTDCSLTKNVYVSDEVPLGFENIVGISPTCFKNNGEITIQISGGTGPYLYSVSNGYNIVSYSKTLNLTGLSFGVYVVSITDATLCKINQNVELVGENGGIAEVVVKTVNSTCASDNGSVTIGVTNGTEPYVYTFINPKGDTITKSSYQSQYVFENLKTGTYTVGIEDSVGCSYFQEITIISENKFITSISSTGTTYGQNNGAIEVSIIEGGTPPFNYSLDDTKKILKTNLNTITFRNVEYGQHTIVVSDSTGCFQTKKIAVENLQSVNFFLTSKPADNGNDGEINVFLSSGVPPFNYIWSENVVGNPQKITLTGLTAGTYSLTIIDSNKSSLKKEIEVYGSTILDSYQIYEMGGDDFKGKTSTKYGLLQFLNEGYYDLISGHTDCDFVSATFYAILTLMPSGIKSTQSFYTSTSLFDVPPENLWSSAVKSLLLETQGISDVIINDFDNTIKVISDINNPQIIKGPESILDIVVDVSIDYNINCRQ
jgi:hypothetical protein